MSKLFILGNGFDLAHKLKTSYEDFHQYLKEKYSVNDEEDLYNIPEAALLPDGSEYYDYEEVAKLLIYVISVAEGLGNKWSNFEDSLGELDFDGHLSFYGDVYEENPWKKVYLNEDISLNLYSCALKVKDLFSDWINSININKCKKNSVFNSLIDSQKDTFLTFNYTHVLESIYKAKNVFHIHGEQNSEIIIGHGYGSRSFKEKYLGAELNLNNIHEGLKKNTCEIIKNSDFFVRNLISIKEIYSYGFSFSKADYPYIVEICKKLSTNDVIWYLSRYEDEATRDNYKVTIRSAGFKGRFKVFNI
ncbi:bacteriophage abortive infection AbiH family protein [Metaclostridioides mangenotii]|uniref:bacteriophage abortive infection AbiH family protein n=1 Tax=Metaclostridioides mangenotii TaxID=1540 RepID=UPI0026EFB163|nr:bacteriophage abortive infection AbiH family protein [Clostridioides mangenotii]